MMISTRKLAFALLMSAGYFGTNAAAQAGLLPVSAMAVPDGTDYRYTYGIVLTSDSQIKPGDYFTIFDFNGYVAGSNVQPPNFDFTMSNTGGNPEEIIANDDPTKPNLTWTYTGTDPISGQVGLGNFSVISTNAPGGPADFASLSVSSSTNAAEKNITEIVSPSEMRMMPPGVPEPSTLALLAIGAPLFGLFGLLRRRA